MEVIINISGTQKILKKYKSDNVDIIPRKGDILILDPSDDKSYQVEFIGHTYEYGLNNQTRVVISVEEL